MNRYFFGKNEIHTWLIDLDSYFSQVDELYQSLTNLEKIRAKKFIFKALENRYIIAHAAVRLLLAKYLNNNSFEYAYGFYGKPYLKEAELYFNLSHSNQYACVAIAPFEVGIDIEYVQEENGIIESIFSQKELEQFVKIHKTQKHFSFYQSWTRKEAYLKALGLGLSKPIDETEVAFSIPTNWSFITLDFCKNYAGTVVANKTNVIHTLHEICNPLSLKLVH